MDKGLSIKVTDQNGRVWPTQKPQGLVIKNTENGYAEANWSYDRSFQAYYSDLASFANVRIDNSSWIYNTTGTQWQGWLVGPTSELQGGIERVSAQALGYWATLNFLKRPSSLATGTPESQIALLFSGGYLPHLLNDTTGLAVTGVASNIFNTNNGTTFEFVADIVRDLCNRGTSTGLRVVPSVWENRKLVTTILPATPAPRYKVDVKWVESMTLHRSLLTVYNRVSVLYKNNVGTTVFINVDDTTTPSSQTRYGFNYGAGAVPFIRQYVADITSMGNMPSAVQPTDYANQYLAKYARLRNIATNAITLKPGALVMDTVLGRTMPLFAVRAGTYFQIQGLYPRPTSGGTGTQAGDGGTDKYFYVSATEYNHDSGKLALSPEVKTDLSNQ